MKKSVKAALLSGLVFPGIGHLFLKHYARAAALMVAAMLGLIYVINDSVQQALSILAQIEGSAIPLDTASLIDIITRTANSSENTRVNMAMLIIVVCWAVGIIDSYRIGRIKDRAGL